MTDAEQRAAARQFVIKISDKGFPCGTSAYFCIALYDKE